MYRGRWQLGQEIAVGTQCRDASDTPTLPTLPPVMEIWTGAGVKVISKAIPIVDRYVQTGLFKYRQFLDGRFSTGNYMVLYYYTVGSYDAIDIDYFEIVAGGDEDGAVLAMTYFQKPHAEFLVQQTDAGLTFQGRNPRL